MLDLTVITLSKCIRKRDIRRFAECIWKFHLRCNFAGRLRHLIVDASPEPRRSDFRHALRNLPEITGVEFHEGQGSVAKDLNLAFSLTETKYSLVFFSDHVLENVGQDFLSECAACLDANGDVYQIHLSGPHTEWSVQRTLYDDFTFRKYVETFNPFRSPYYPWFRLDEDRLWYGGRMMYSRGIPAPGNPLERRVIRPEALSLWVSPPQPKGEEIRSHAGFIEGGGVKHLALGFNGAPCFFNMEIFNSYLPIPEDLEGPSSLMSELYFYRQTDIDRKYAIGWMNAQTFFWHDDYGWTLRSETEQAIFRELLLRKQL